MTTADVWNRDNVTGRAVKVTREDGTCLITQTRSSAMTRDGVSLIYVEGISGLYPLDRVVPYNGSGDILDADRVSGLVVCERCGKLFYDHPPDLEHTGSGGFPFLHLLCDGRSVKL